MKRISIVVLVMFLLLVAAPWGIGRLAEKRVNDGLDRIVQQAPYLTIVERKWTRGWFRSGQEVTFEVFGAWRDAFDPPPASAAAVEMDAAAEEAQELERDDSPEIAGADDAVEAESPPEPAPAPAKPLRITVRNEILHGPVLWPASLGLARVNSKLVLTEEIRKQLMDFFGTDEPVRISSRIGFFGGGSTRLYGEGRTLEMKQDGGLLAYDDFEFEVDYTRKFDDFDMEGSWSKLEYTDKNTGEHMRVAGMSLEGESERILGDVFDTDIEMEIDELRLTGSDRSETTAEDIHYVVETSHDDGFVDVAARMGTGKVRIPAFEELELDLREVHYDFTMRHLHVETLDKLMTAIKASYTQPVATVAGVEPALLAPFEEHGLALLKHQPEFSIDRIGVVTGEGDGVIKGVVRLQGVTEADLAAGVMSLLGRIVADIQIEVAQTLLEKIPNGSTGAGMAVDQGFAKREGQKLVSRIEFSQGELKVNGKPLPIPGLGASPPPQE